MPNPDHPTLSFSWWLALAVTALAWAFFARARVAFRTLSPVTAEALVERLGDTGAEFLRKSMRGPTAFWFTLHIVDALSMLAFMVVLLSGGPALAWASTSFRIGVTETAGHDLLLFFLLAFLVLLVEFVMPVVTTRGDRARVIVLSLPVVRLAHHALSPLTNVLARLASDEPSDEDQPNAAAEEVDAFIDVGTREGILEENEGEMLRNLVTFGDTRVREVMTPRTDVVGIESTASVRQAIALMAKTRHARLPVHGGQLDDVVGVASLKEAVRALLAGKGDEPVLSLVRRSLIAPESKRVAELLREMQSGRQQLAIVVDEYGGTAGLVTLEDLLEELVGEIREEHEEGEDIFRLPDGTWQVRGRALLHDVGEVIGTELDDVESDTVGGLLLARFERVPRPGEHLDWSGWRFEVEQADRKRVQSVRIAPAPPPVPGAASETQGAEEGAS